MIAIFVLLIMSTCGALSARSAFVVVPCTDVVGEPMSKSTNQVRKKYRNLPLCGATINKNRACPRIHQLLFNEVVDIVEENAEEYCIKVPNIFFVTGLQKQPYNTFWTLKSSLMPIDILSGADRAKIPQFIAYANATIESTNTNTVTLLYPWHGFSAGTRFVLSDEQPDDQAYHVYRWDHAHHTMRTTALDKKMCINTNGLAPQEKIGLFVTIAKEWAHLTDSYIPYVWGGCSFFTPCHGTTFHEKTVTEGKNTYSYYVIDGYHSVPKSGLDCSGLVARIAQLCGIPYFFKNTTTIAHYLASLTKNDTLQEGDLLWVPGHVMIVSDLDNNTLIEARHYAQGYGKVHEIALEKVFDGIKTYDDLLERYYQNAPIKRLDINGAVTDTFTTFKILKMASCWQHGA